VKPPEAFLARWSRLKRKESAGAAEAPAADPEAPGREPAAHRSLQPGPPGPPLAGAPQPEAKPPAGDCPVDLADLPAIDSISAGSDIRAFLRSGVPAELTKAALRRAWTSDPAIRDFIGIAENQWDFTDPQGIPGFGCLAAHEDVAPLVRQALGQGLPPPAGEPALSPVTPEPRASSATQVHGIPDRNAGDGADTGAVEDQQDVPIAAAQHAAPPADAVRTSSRRTHGSARPK
jgi:Protein of unknown function (DUF3306)